MEDKTKSQPPEPAYLVPYQPYAPDEISLVDLWLVLVRRRWILFSVFGVIVVLAVIYTLLKGPIYEPKTTIQLGHVTGNLLVPVAEVAARLRSLYIPDPDDRELPYIESVNQDKSLLEIKALGKDPGKVRALLHTVTSGLLNRQQKLYRQAVTQQKSEIGQVEGNLSALRDQVDALSTAKKNISAQDGSQAALLELEKSRLVSEISNLEHRKSGLTKVLSSRHTYPTKTIVPLAAELEPVGSKTKLYLALGVVLGVILGVFGAFFVEFIHKARQEMRDR